jgi:hypothetical protein
VLSAVFALWCLRELSRTQDLGAGIGAALGAAGVVGLLVYGVRFVRRMKDVGYL